MSSYAELPQTSSAKTSLQHKTSLSSLSGTSIIERTGAREETTSPHGKNGIPRLGDLAPSSVLMVPGNGDVKWKCEASSSPALNAYGPPSTSPLLGPQPDHTYLGTAPSTGYDTLITNRNLYNNMHQFWVTNRSYLLVIFSTFFGSLMTLLTKLLESDGNGMHAFQILFLRMVASWVVCVGFLYYTKRSEFPFGPKDVRWLLFVRGAFGFLGIGGLWTALSELPEHECRAMRLDLG